MRGLHTRVDRMGSGATSAAPPPRGLWALAVVVTEAASAHALPLRPVRVFDGETMRAGWAALVRADTIAVARPADRLVV